jgi:hypothetical protein
MSKAFFVTGAGGGTVTGMRLHRSGIRLRLHVVWSRLLLPKETVWMTATWSRTTPTHLLRPQ